MSEFPWVGNWKFESSENVQGDIHKTLGYPPNVMQIFNANKGVVLYSVVQEGDAFVATFSLPGCPPMKEKFQLGVEHVGREASGAEAKVLVEWNPDTSIMLETRKNPDYTWTISKLYQDGKATLTMKAKDDVNISTWIKE